MLFINMRWRFSTWLMFLFFHLPPSDVIAQESSLLPTPTQEIEILFGERTLLDEGGVHIEALHEKASEDLTLPKIDLSTARFLTLFYSYDVEGDYQISVLVISGDKGDSLFIDLNNDEDLTNDGGPIFFPQEESELAFWLIAQDDPAQQTGRLLQRVPRMVRTDSTWEPWFRNMHDEGGNLKPEFAFMYNIDGKKGSFLFDDRLSLSRGQLALDSTLYAIGIYDFTENGRFDDEEDLLLIDLDSDGLLNMQQETHVFKMDDVFEIEGSRYKLTYVDPYGRGMRIAEVTDKPTQHYLDDIRKSIKEADIPFRSRNTVDSTFWQLSLQTISGDSLRLATYKGQYVLLNVWGEWCSPCLAETPALVATYHKVPPTKLKIIGLLASSDLEAVQVVMNELGILWPQVPLNASLRERFKIWRYPTNLLFLPDGETYLEVGIVNEAFFDKHIQ